jgi:hypothetical protein
MMEHLLALGASAASQQRYAVAQKLAASCPLDLGIEMALTGSTSRGLASATSDLEINLWTESLPPLAARREWLIAVGVGEVAICDQIRSDASYWITGCWGDLPLELGWQTFAAWEDSLQRILAGDYPDPRWLRLPNLWQHAIPLRGGGYLAAIQNQLQSYPAALQKRVIQRVLHVWRDQPQWATPQQEIERCLRLLFALNHQWESRPKWIAIDAAGLMHKPTDLVDKVRAGAWRDLLADTLALLPPPYDPQPIWARLSSD